jgi:hypothetical protein
MKKRSIVAVLLLAMFTFGIYPLIWHVNTKSEMVSAGADIPTAWLLIVPIANLYWIWKWCGGIEHVSRGKMSAPVAFLVHLCLPVLGMAILQDTLNKAVDAGTPAQIPQARIA